MDGIRGLTGKEEKDGKASESWRENPAEILLRSSKKIPFDVIGRAEQDGGQSLRR